MNEVFHQDQRTKRLWDPRISGAVVVTGGIAMCVEALYDHGQYRLLAGLVGLAFVLLGIRAFLPDLRHRQDPFSFSPPLRTNPKAYIAASWYVFAILLIGWVVVLTLHQDRVFYAVFAILFGGSFLEKGLRAAGSLPTKLEAK